MNAIDPMLPPGEWRIDRVEVETREDLFGIHPIVGLEIDIVRRHSQRAASLFAFLSGVQMVPIFGWGGSEFANTYRRG